MQFKPFEIYSQERLGIETTLIERIVHDQDGMSSVVAFQIKIHLTVVLHMTFEAFYFHQSINTINI